MYENCLEEALAENGIRVEMYTNPMWPRPQIAVDTKVHDTELREKFLMELRDLLNSKSALGLYAAIEKMVGEE